MSFYTIRERERELFGPKKRGPKPETFLLKVGEVLDLCHETFQTSDG